MLGDITVAKNIYLACGYTDMRKSIDGLAAMVQEQFHLDPFSQSLYLFCGRRRNRLKVLFWEGDGFVLLNKRLENGNFKWLIEGLEIDQPKAIRSSKQGACIFRLNGVLFPLAAA